MHEVGCFEWYEEQKDLFFVFLIKAIMHADLDNTDKLRKIFPHICMAYKEPSWLKKPKTDYPITININRGIDNNFDLELLKDFQEGSFAWYLKHSGHFVTYLAKAIYHADDHNVALIFQQYPQMVAAYNVAYNDWNMCPEGFESNTYNSPHKILQKTLS